MILDGILELRCCQSHLLNCCLMTFVLQESADYAAQLHWAVCRGSATILGLLQTEYSICPTHSSAVTDPLIAHLQAWCTLPTGVRWVLKVTSIRSDQGLSRSHRSIRTRHSQAADPFPWLQKRFTKPPSDCRAFGAATCMMPRQKDILRSAYTDDMYIYIYIHIYTYSHIHI